MSISIVIQIGFLLVFCTGYDIGCALKLILIVSVAMLISSWNITIVICDNLKYCLYVFICIEPFLNINSQLHFCSLRCGYWSVVSITLYNMKPEIFGACSKQTCASWNRVCTFLATRWQFQVLQRTNFYGYISMSKRQIQVYFSSLIFLIICHLFLFCSFVTVYISFCLYWLSNCKIFKPASIVDTFVVLSFPACAFIIH